MELSPAHFYAMFIRGLLREMAQHTQEIISDFYGSLQEATKSGIVYGEKITQGNWEFIFAQPRQSGQLLVIKHAQFNGWH